MGPFHTPGEMWRQARRKCLLVQPNAVLICTSCATLFKQQINLHPFVRPWACWSENEVCLGALSEHCYFEASEINWPTKTCSTVNGAAFIYLFLFFISTLVICAYRRVQNVPTLLLHTQGHAAAHKRCKILLLRRLHKFKMSIIMALQCMYQNKAIYLLTHKQLHFLCESTLARTQLALKGNGRWDSDWFIAHYAQNTSITKRIGTTLFVPCAGLRDHFSHRWTSESGFGHALSTPAPCALDHALRSLN